MANRVVLDSTRLSISQPGFDVLTAGPSNMIFDSRFGEYGGVFMTGHATGYGVDGHGQTSGHRPFCPDQTGNGQNGQGHQGVEHTGMPG